VHLLSDLAESPRLRGHYARVKKDWGTDLEANLFTDMPHIISFFQTHGFTVEIRSHMETLPFLSSPARLDLAPETVREVLRRRYNLVLRQRK